MDCFQRLFLLICTLFDHTSLVSSFTFVVESFDLFVLPFLLQSRSLLQYPFLVHPFSSHPGPSVITGLIFAAFFVPYFQYTLLIRFLQLTYIFTPSLSPFTFSPFCAYQNLFRSPDHMCSSFSKTPFFHSNHSTNQPSIPTISYIRRSTYPYLHIYPMLFGV
ncbi:hypothetical protein VKT23_011205 [Stygiomarasmius scandens]|uniref:Uncharacterized protein n=1 Tax=Marasmiellus scandens TaxID=2682957 RepID=A0ABR1J8V7_9AGAR